MYVVVDEVSSSNYFIYDIMRNEVHVLYVYPDGLELSLFVIRFTLYVYTCTAVHVGLHVQYSIVRKYA